MPQLAAAATYCFVFAESCRETDWPSIVTLHQGSSVASMWNVHLSKLDDDTKLPAKRFVTRTALTTAPAPVGG